MTEQLDWFAIQKLAANAGFIGRQSDTAASIALAESGGNPTAHNTKPPDDSYGLWQINMFKGIDPRTGKPVDLLTPRLALFRSIGVKTPTDLLDPVTNAKAAKLIYNKQGFKAWTTYTSEAYKKFDKTNPITSGTPLQNPTNALTEAGTDAKDAIPGAIQSIGENLFKGAANIAGILVAITLFVVGIVILTVNSKSGKAVVGTAVSLASPGGKVAAAANIAKKVAS